MDNINNFKRFFSDLKSAVRLIHVALILCALIVAIITYTSFIIEIFTLKILLWLAVQIPVLVIISILLSEYLCEGNRCEGTRAIFSAMMLLLAMGVALAFLVITIVSLFQSGCAAIPACQNQFGVFVTDMILVGLLVLLEGIVALYLLLSLRNTLNACKKCNVSIGKNVRSMKDKSNQRLLDFESQVGNKFE